MRACLNPFGCNVLVTSEIGLGVFVFIQEDFISAAVNCHLYISNCNDKLVLNNVTRFLYTFYSSNVLFM